MVIDYGTLDGTTIDPTTITNDTYNVHFTSTVDYGKNTGNVYADKDLTVTGVSVEGNQVTVDFDASEASTLTWLEEGRNYPGKLSLTVTQVEKFQSKTTDGRYLDVNVDTYEYTNTVSSYKDLHDEEVEKFESRIDTINYQIHKGTNDKLIVWFHGNGEGDFPTKDTNNNIAQVLANRGTVAWVSEEAQAVFGDATVISFQSPSVWYTATKDGYLQQSYEIIQKIIAEQNINPDELYLSGCSAGGFMSTRMLIQYPDLFKAAMINCPALNVADERAGFVGATPSDEEILSLRDSKTAIWLVQGETDSSVTTEECSQRIFNLLTDPDDILLASTDNGLASSIHTYETSNNKYKLTLYSTENGKLTFEEDYNKDGVKEAVQYSDHWSWIYTLRNNPVTGAGIHIWNWAVNYSEQPSAPKVIYGTQKVFVVGDDWGPAVNKTILTLDQAVDATTLSKDNFFVYEIKESTNWTNMQVENMTAEREVVDVYLSDASGNRVTDEKGINVTVEMYISPNDGSPFRYDVASGSNKWCNYYQLRVSGDVTIDGNEHPIYVDNTLDLADQSNWLTDEAYKFDVTKSFTGSDGIVMPYGMYSPSQDDKQNALVVWLHGAGEGVSKYNNDNYIDLLGNEVTALVSDEFQNLFSGAYVITPQAQTMWMDGGDGSYQNGDKGSMYEATLFELIEDVVNHNPDIDPNRVIIGGCSNGGYMTMEMVLKHPDYFYKAFPICEAYQEQYITDEQIQALKDGGTELWFTYALTDTTVNPELTSIPTIERMKEAGIPLHVSEYADVHDTTGRFWMDADGNLTKENTGKPYEYNGHWSWIYFDNNTNVCDDCGENCWKWLADYVEEKPAPEDKPTTGTQTTDKKTGVQTNDDSQIMLYAGMFIIAITASACFIMIRKKHS